MAAAFCGLLLMTGALRDPRVGPPTRPIGWSNPQGTTLTQIRPDVWLAERPFFPTLPGMTSTDVGGKMAVVRLADGGLWVHSPVALDEPLRLALAELGPVKHIVTPNTEHQKWAPDWIRAYPDATSYACPGLRERKPEVGWTRSVGAPGDGHPFGGLDVVLVGDAGQLAPQSGQQLGAPYASAKTAAQRAGSLLHAGFFDDAVVLTRANRLICETDADCALARLLGSERGAAVLLARRIGIRVVMPALAALPCAAADMAGVCSCFALGACAADGACVQCTGCSLRAGGAV
jgi:hypothetical protein